jgi:hypothetical protein
MRTAGRTAAHTRPVRLAKRPAANARFAGGGVTAQSVRNANATAITRARGSDVHRGNLTGLIQVDLP